MYTTREKRIQCILKKVGTHITIYQQSQKNGVKVFQKMNGLLIMGMVTGGFQVVSI